jgi:hypothetical protein
LFAGTARRGAPDSFEPDDAERSDDSPLLRDTVLPPLPLLEDPPLRGDAVPLLLEPPRDRCSLARAGGVGCAHGVAAFDDPDDWVVQPVPPALTDPPLEPASLPELTPPPPLDPPLLDPPPLEPLGTAEPPPSPRGTALPVVLPFDVRS